MTASSIPCCATFCVAQYVASTGLLLQGSLQTKPSKYWSSRAKASGSPVRVDWLLYLEVWDQHVLISFVWIVTKEPMDTVAAFESTSFFQALYSLPQIVSWVPMWDHLHSSYVQITHFYCSLVPTFSALYEFFWEFCHNLILISILENSVNETFLLNRHTLYRNMYWFCC